MPRKSRRGRKPKKCVAKENEEEESEEENSQQEIMDTQSQEMS